MINSIEVTKIPFGSQCQLCVQGSLHDTKTSLGVLMLLSRLSEVKPFATSKTLGRTQ